MACGRCGGRGEYTAVLDVAGRFVPGPGPFVVRCPAGCPVVPARSGDGLPARSAAGPRPEAPRPTLDQFPRVVATIRMWLDWRNPPVRQVNVAAGWAGKGPAPGAYVEVGMSAHEPPGTAGGDRGVVRWRRAKIPGYVEGRPDVIEEVVTTLLDGMLRNLGLDEVSS